MGQKKQEEFNFESALEELEAIVLTMEQGDLSLDKSLEAFEQGVKLTRACQQALKEAEQRVQLVTTQGDDVQVSPFQENNDE